jgi:SulP family sulfate permease
MGAWDFVIGILVGILLACVNFVVQTSRKSAIRATYYGDIAGSLVRRHPLQHQYLREVGRQIHITKLAGFLFFGTIVSVENRIRDQLAEEAFQQRPIRYLVVDMWHVTGIDFSAAEAFTRIHRLLSARGVSLVMCGVKTDNEFERSLRNVGLFATDKENPVRVFEDLNSALEYCENELLKTFHSQRDVLTQRNAGPRFMDIPRSDQPTITFDTSFSSPRRSQLRFAADTALNDSEVSVQTRWQNFKQPLPLILQIFQGLSEQNEDFWFRAVPFFERKNLMAGKALYKSGDAPNGFYLLEEGILRAEYGLPQGKYYESIIAGTSCGELPFFSETGRTATVIAERDCVAWMMDDKMWNELQKKEPDVAHELLRIVLKLTSERMSAITS